MKNNPPKVPGIECTQSKKGFILDSSKIHRDAHLRKGHILLRMTMVIILMKTVIVFMIMMVVVAERGGDDNKDDEHDNDDTIFIHFRPWYV